MYKKKMKTERKAALLVITENIEMELFSSEESCVMTQTQEEEEEQHSFDPVSIKQAQTTTLVILTHIFNSFP